MVNPDIIRSLDVGQAAYISRGGVTYVQVKRVVAGPAALPAPVPPRPVPREEPASEEEPAPRDGRRTLPDAKPFLDEVLGGPGGGEERPR